MKSSKRFQTEPGRWHAVGSGLLLLLFTLLLYAPSLRNGFIWDDDFHVTENPYLRSWSGLCQIWFSPVSLPYPVGTQYYPLSFTVFALENWLWGLQPLGYHLVNALLHGANAFLVFWLLRLLRVPGAWAAAAIFAVHPVHVESVAWVMELKNVLSCFFYLLSGLFFLHWIEICPWRQIDKRPRSHSGDGRPRLALYVSSLLCFIAAMLAKSVVCSLPAALLVVIWWKQGRLSMRRHIVPLLPFFVLGAALGLLTPWMEKHRVGAEGHEWSLSFVQRWLMAGRAFWFYVGELLWPTKLTFMYPRWELPAGDWRLYVFPLSALAALVVPWLLRGRLGSGVAAALFIYAGTLFPALGFFDVYPFRYSSVADHFQYHASIALTALFVAAVVCLVPRAGAAAMRARVPVTAAVLVVLAAIGWQQQRVYRNEETLWNDTISRNPGAWMAYFNLGKYLKKNGRVPEAIDFYQRGLRLQPNDDFAHFNLAIAYSSQGKIDTAIGHYAEALRINPQMIMAHNNIGSAYLSQANLEKAVFHYQEALRLEPASAMTNTNLGIALQRQGKHGEAEACYRKAVELNPDSLQAWKLLGTTLAARQRYPEAIDCYHKAAALEPNDWETQANLGLALLASKDAQAAVEQLQRALASRPDSPDILCGLGEAAELLGQPDQAAGRYRQALEKRPDHAKARTQLARLEQATSPSQSLAARTTDKEK